MPERFKVTKSEDRGNLYKFQDNEETEENLDHPSEKLLSKSNEISLIGAAEQGECYITISRFICILYSIRVRFKLY